MIHQLYDIISIYLTGLLLLIGGGCFLLIPTPGNPLLRSYRKARMMMACAYLFFAAVNGLEFMCRHPGSDTLLATQMATLAIAFSQAFLFTWALIALLNVQWMQRRRFFRESALVLAFVATVFAVYFALPADSARIIFYLLTGLYLVQLIRYTRLFIGSYLLFKQRMHNFFADEQERHLHWVVFSFCAALVIGVLALLSALFMSHTGALLFSIVLAAFYAYFAVRFLRYGYSFRVIEPAMEDVEPAPCEDADAVYPAAFASIETKITQWVANEGFTQQGITLDKLAAELYTNRSYLSCYINKYHKQTFREWINELRIEEAQKLLRQHPEMSIHEIALHTGFANKSNFGRQFLKQTDLTPGKWRKIQPLETDLF
ncbi:MAG: helix-turn-helix domain-containing protein [Tannerellaceae bacterium]|jgi:AraC-like DNA-binding protein|nr:helix-turn-helix domain-containing protein [Tannerellaceae bacterium]